MKKIFLIFSTIFLSVFCFAQQPVVQDLQAQFSKGTKVNIFWTLPENVNPPIRKLKLYRTTKPVFSYTQIENDQPIATLDADCSGYTDSLSDYNEYYYAIIAVTDEPYNVIFVSMNATVNGVHLAEPEYKPAEPKKKNEDKLYSKGNLRETPLPFINYLEGQTEEGTISENVVQATSQFSGFSNTAKTKAVQPYYFEEDLVSPDGGDDYILFSILKNYFVQENYEVSISQLKRITETNISQDVQNRAFFYIGEAQFFTGDYEEAVKNFVKVAHIYPLETKVWINMALDMISVN